MFVPMESFIEKKLRNPEVRSQEDLKRLVMDVQSKITLFEKQAYDKDKVTADVLKKIKSWRTRLLAIVRGYNGLPAKEDPEDQKGLETLRLLNKQLEHADVNRKLLDKSTLKVASLDFSTDELETVIVETRKKFEANLKREEVDYRRIVLAFIVFLGVCFGILFDKFYMKMIR